MPAALPQAPDAAPGAQPLQRLPAPTTPLDALSPHDPGLRVATTHAPSPVPLHSGSDDVSL